MSQRYVCMPLQKIRFLRSNSVGDVSQNTSSTSRQLRRRCGDGVLVFQQPALAMQAPGVTSELAVTGDDAMAGHDDGNRIGAVGCANGNGRARVTETDSACQRAITTGLTRRNEAQGLPYPALQIGAGSCCGKRIKRVKAAVKVVLQCLRNCDGRYGRHHCLVAIMQPQLALQMWLVIGEIQRPYLRMVVAHQ